MGVSVVFEGHACIDCTLVIANGDESGIPEELYDEWIGGIESGRLFELGHVVMACPDDCEGEYRTDPCDYCGSPLHGVRHPIAVLA